MPSSLESDKESSYVRKMSDSETGRLESLKQKETELEARKRKIEEREKDLEGEKDKKKKEKGAKDVKKEQRKDDLRKLYEDTQDYEETLWNEQKPLEEALKDSEVHILASKLSIGATDLKEKVGEAIKAFADPNRALALASLVDRTLKLFDEEKMEDSLHTEENVEEEKLNSFEEGNKEEEILFTEEKAEILLFF